MKKHKSQESMVVEKLREEIQRHIKQYRERRNILLEFFFGEPEYISALDSISNNPSGSRLIFSLIQIQARFMDAAKTMAPSVQVIFKLLSQFLYFQLDASIEYVSKSKYQFVLLAALERIEALSKRRHKLEYSHSLNGITSYYVYSLYHYTSQLVSIGMEFNKNNKIDKFMQFIKEFHDFMLGLNPQDVQKLIPIYWSENVLRNNINDTLNHMRSQPISFITISNLSKFYKLSDGNRAVIFHVISEHGPRKLDQSSKAKVFFKDLMCFLEKENADDILFLVNRLHSRFCEDVMRVISTEPDGGKSNAIRGLKCLNSADSSALKILYGLFPEKYFEEKDLLAFSIDKLRTEAVNNIILKTVNPMLTNMQTYKDKIGLWGFSLFKQVLPSFPDYRAEVAGCSEDELSLQDKNCRLLLR